MNPFLPRRKAASPRRPHHIVFGALASLWLATLVPATATADELRVAVAGNFAPALQRLAEEFEASSGHRLRLSPGATGKLYAQIVQGAPFDLFLAADADRPRRLEADGRIVPGTRRTYVHGRLALWAPNCDCAPLAHLRDTPPPRLALANPRVAPYGAAAEAYLRDEQLWDVLGPRAVRGESVAQAFHFLASGNADLGFVALSQLRLTAQAPATFVVIPADRHPPIEQQVVLLNDTVAGRAFLQWLLAPGTRSRLGEFGYDSP